LLSPRAKLLAILGPNGAGKSGAARDPPAGAATVALFGSATVC
jgi:hypothetical protein